MIEKRAQIQSAVDVDMEALDTAIRAHAEDIDAYLYSLLFAGAAHSQAFTGEGTKITQADIVDAKQKVKATKVQNLNGNLFLAANSVEEATLLKISDFIDASKFGSNEVILNGMIGKASGVNIVISESVTAGNPVLYHRSALAWGLQLSPEIMRQDNLDYVSVDTLIHQLYGAKLLNSGKFACKMNA
jgi:hypothetical protein